MEIFFKATAAVLIVVILAQVFEKQERHLTVLLTVAVCSMVGMIAFSFLEPVLDFLRELEAMAQLQEDMLAILLKLVGVGITAEIAALICSDASSGSLGKSLQFLASAVILYLSIPIFNAFFAMIREILGEL